jgi:hypothetical protein
LNTVVAMRVPVSPELAALLADETREAYVI